MGRTDAFGRDPDEDPLAGLRGEEAAPPGGRPAQAAARDALAPPPRPRTVRRRARRDGGMPGWVVLVSLLGAAGFLIPLGVIAAQAVLDAADDVQQVRDPGGSVREAVEEQLGRRGVTPGAAPTTPAAPAPPPVGLQRGSFLTRAALAPVLAGLQGRGRVVRLRVAAERVDATLRLPDGRQAYVQVRPGGTRTLATTSSAGQPTFPAAAADPAAPYRLVRSAAGRLRLPTSRIDYVLASPGTPVRWVAYFQGGRGIFVGDARGRVVRRIS